MLETAAVIEPTIAPANDPKTSPVMMIKNVQGLIFGRAAKGILDAAVMAPNIPINATSLELISDSSNFAKMMPKMNRTKRNDRKAAY